MDNRRYDRRNCVEVNKYLSTPVGKYLFKVSKITLEQRPNGRCSNVILLTLNRYLPTGTDRFYMISIKPSIMKILLLKMSVFLLSCISGLEITGDHHCGGEIFQSIFSQFGWKYSEKSLLHSDDRQLFRALYLIHVLGFWCLCCCDSSGKYSFWNITPSFNITAWHPLWMSVLSIKL